MRLIMRDERRTLVDLDRADAKTCTPTDVVVCAHPARTVPPSAALSAAGFLCQLSQTVYTPIVCFFSFLIPFAFTPAYCTRRSSFLWFSTVARLLHPLGWPGIRHFAQR